MLRNVAVKSLNWDKTYEYNDDDTLYDLIKKIEENELIKFFIFKGELLKDDIKIASLKLTKNDFIVCIPRSKTFLNQSLNQSQIISNAVEKSFLNSIFDPL